MKYKERLLFLIKHTILNWITVNYGISEYEDPSYDIDDLSLQLTNVILCININEVT